MKSEVANKTDFSTIRYAQCWEDADILLAGLDIQPQHTCLAIASAGDNALAMLSKSPKRVIALDLNPAQLACLALRVAAYRTLEHPELLVLIGSRQGMDRLALYQRCRPHLGRDVQAFWDARPMEIAYGIGSIGKFEKFLRLFRRNVLPWIHSERRVERLLSDGPVAERTDFYNNVWNSRAWRGMFRLFFSQFVIGRLGRDPRFFDYANESIASHLLQRTRHALVNLNPAENPYLQWILRGRHMAALPYALRAENFDAIRQNLDRLEWHAQPIETFLDTNPGLTIDRFNLSNIFEYMSAENYHRLLERLVNASSAGGRLAYWNMLVPRSRPQQMADQLRPLSGLASSLYAQDKAFFYRDFILEEVAA